MSSKTWILNSIDSTDSVDIEITGYDGIFSCTGVINGVLTVCEYVYDLKPNHYCVFDTHQGVHIQTSPNSAPNGVWGCDSGYFKVAVNKKDGTIIYEKTKKRDGLDNIVESEKVCKINSVKNGGGKRE